MCFYLFIAADVPIPEIAYAPEKVYIYDIEKSYPGVKQHFSLPYQMGVGSTNGCGCGFRNEDFGEEAIVPPETFGLTPGEMDGLIVDYGNFLGELFANGEGEADHDQLSGILLQLLERSSYVELYGCWEFYWDEPAMGSKEITVSQIRHKHFYFRHGFLYKVTKDD